MNVSDVFSYAFGAIKLRKLRAGLTTLGVVIGIAAIVALLSITQGLQDTITGQLQTGFATDTLIVSPGGGFVWRGMGAATESDFRLLINHTQIVDELEGVSMSAAIIRKSCYIESDGRESTITVVGVDFAKYMAIYGSTFVAESGEIPSNPENQTVIVGKRVSDPWQNGTLLLDIDDTVEITWTNTTIFPFQNETYTGHVVVILNEIGGFGIGPSDYNVYIPISQAQSFFGTDECDSIAVKLENDDETTIESVSEAIEEAFSDQVSASSSTAILNTVSSIFSTVELFLAGIAAISLLVAGIGIMNIMIVSLMERTKEIGILKALGTKNRTILLIFLCEAAIIGLIGAVIGTGAGWILANIVAIILSNGGGGGFMQGRTQAASAGGMAITPVLTSTVFAGAIAFGLAVSVVFALYPAWRASKLNPVEALRYE